MQLAIEHPIDADLVMPVPDTGAPAAAGYAEASGHAVPRGHGPQPLHRADVHPAVGAAPPSRRDDQAQPAARGRRGQAPHRRRRFDRPRARRPSRSSRCCARPAPTEVHVRISAPPIYHPCFYGIDTQIETELIAATHYRRRRSGSSSAPIRSATSRSAASSPRSTCRTSGSASPASTATTRSRSRTTREPQVHARGAGRPRGRPDAEGLSAARRLRERPASTSRPGSGRSSSCAPRSNRHAGRRSSAASAASAAPIAHPGRLPRARCSSPRPTASARRPRSRPRSAASTRSASTSSRCAPTTSSAAAPSRSRSSTTSPSGGSMPEGVAELVGVDRGRAAARPAARSSAARPPSIPGLMDADAFDLSGCCIGVVERDDLIDGTAARAGDAILGLPSSRAARERLLARPCAARPAGTSTSTEPYQERLRRSLGDAAARRGDRGRAGRRRWRRSARSC